MGIQDLRHGNILDEEWDGLPLDDRTGRRLDVPLHPGVRHLAIVGLLGRRIDGRVAQLLGDDEGEPDAVTALLAGYPPCAVTVFEYAGDWRDLTWGAATVRAFHVGRG